MPRTQASLRAYVVQRLLLTGPMVLILLTLVFYFLRAAPGDPVGAILGEHSGPLADSIRRQLGLYDPLYVQYVDYLRRIFTGDMGNSIITQHSVAADIAQRLPATIELTVASMFVAVLAGMLLGVVSATRRCSTTRRSSGSESSCSLFSPSNSVGSIPVADSRRSLRFRRGSRVSTRLTPW